ncbi:hypothetical protein BH10PSE17_BH10PSE17_26800 [soil metagenome]
MNDTAVITTFLVDNSGALSLADHTAPVTRSDVYLDNGAWAESPEALVEEMLSLQPLMWAVAQIYDEHATGDMPADAEKGAADWLMSMDQRTFDRAVVGPLKLWFADVPDWGTDEDDYVPDTSTAEGAAFQFFRDLDDHRWGPTLGVRVIEGDRPGSNYCVATIGHKRDIDRINTVALAAGIPVRFKRQA